MAKDKQLPDLALGKSWPHVLLQMFPLEWKRRYLLRKSSREKANKSFNLAETLQDAKHFLIIWPERAQDALIAFAAMRVLRDAISASSVHVHLCPMDLKALIADLFPGEQLLSWPRTELAWHEPAIQTLAKSLRACSPDVSINLMRPGSSIIRALVRNSGAHLRMGVDEGDTPYENLRVKSDSDSSLASLYFQFLNPWRYAGFGFQEQWPRLQFNPVQRQDATEVWKSAGMEPEKTWLYVHNLEVASRPLDDDFYLWLWEKIQAHESAEVSIALVVLNATEKLGPLEGRWRDVPVIRTASLSNFSGVVDMACGVAAFQGPGLHMASLTDAHCLAFLKREESAYDVSDWNKKFMVEWI